VTLGEKIRQARKQRRITQRALAGGDLSESFISMLEHDKVRPSLDTIRVLAGRLGLSLSELVDAVPPPRDRVTVKLKLASTLLHQHRFTDALEAFQEAERSAPNPSMETAFRIHTGMGQALTGLQYFDLALDRLERGRALADALGRPDLVARVASATGFLRLRQRDLPAAREAFHRGLAAIRQAVPVDTEFEGGVLTNLGRVYTDLGLPIQALECFQDALARLESAGDITALGALHFNLGVAYERQHAFDLARRHLEKAAALFEAQENVKLLGTVKRSLGILLIDRGLPAEAAQVLKQSLEVADRTADDVGRAQTLTELARAALALGDVAGARSGAEEAIRLAVRLQDPLEAARAESVMAAVCRREGRLDEAAHRYAYAIEEYEALSAAADVARVSRDYAFLLMERGEEARAARYFARAFRAQEAIGVAR
jgi:tetratricopeptide (TPR) repeat protein